MRASAAPPSGPYVIDFNPAVVPEKPDHRSNYIRTTKYTILTFLPLNLFQQFRRFYNLYFLLAAIISLLPFGLAPISPVTSVFPLVLVLVVTMIKDGYEDLKRYRADRAANNSKFVVVKQGQLVETLSKDLRPGDVVRPPSCSCVGAPHVLTRRPWHRSKYYVASSFLRTLCYWHPPTMTASPILPPLSWMVRPI
jgi:hypothetical protein